MILIEGAICARYPKYIHSRMPAIVTNFGSRFLLTIIISEEIKQKAIILLR